MDTQGYDDEELIAMLAQGSLSDQEIAERLGISPSLVAAIARGSRRPELQEAIEKASVELLRRAHRLARAYAGGMVYSLIREALAVGDPANLSPARKAREFLLDRLLPRCPSDQTWVDGEPAPAAALAMLALPGLSAQDLEWIAQRHEGPGE